ncbi:hypothetical protein ABZP36_035130 [Zizania latifolia]
MASQEQLDDSEWEEVQSINGYALFMGYLSMAVRGMGFVSMLGKKDFWSLTIITLVQTAGVFDVFLNEKLSYVGKSFYGLAGTVSAMVFRDEFISWKQILVAYVFLGVQLLVIAVVLCPLAALYLFGLLITAGLSLWRLIQRDYGQSGGDASAHLAPALNVLYSLALFQGVLFCYRFASRFAAKRLAGEVAGNYGFPKEDHKGRASVMDYLRQTRVGCDKDPSFARGRNLVTFAFALMKPESTSPDDFASGVRILDKLLQKELQKGHALLIRQLVGSASSSQVMHKLLQTLRSTGPHNMDVRENAARIVAHLAEEIRLASFPHGIWCISSLLEMTSTSEQQDDDSAPTAYYRSLMVQGLVILHKLAADEHNRRIISSAQGLLSKAMAPVRADLLHRIDHKAWSEIVAASLQLMSRLVTAPGETGAKLRSQVLNNKDAINTVEKILKCDECNEELCILAIKILTQLPMAADASSLEKFTNLLVAIFTNKTKDTSMRKMAGEALAMLSDQGESNATIIFKASDTIVKDLTEMLLQDDEMKRGCTISAAEILENLYIRYTKEDDHLKKLTEAMKDVLPKLLREILLLIPSKQPEKAEKETDGGKLSSQNADIESQRSVASNDKQNENVSEQNIVDRKLYAALLSLSVTIFEKLITDHEDLAELADTIAPGQDPAFIFARMLKEMVQRNREPTANCLRILKITTRMTISLINLEGGCNGEDLVESLMQSLSNASKAMLELEGIMVVCSSDHSATKPVCILSSLVKEAHDLLEKRKQAQNMGATPALSIETS